MNSTGWLQLSTGLIVLAGILACSCEAVYALGVVSVIFSTLCYFIFVELSKRYQNHTFIQLLCVLLIIICFVDFIAICSMFHSLGFKRGKGWGPTAGVIGALSVTASAGILTYVCIRSMRYHKNIAADPKPEIFPSPQA